MEYLSVELFNECVKKIVEISDTIIDGWKINTEEGHENGLYITRKQSSILNNSCDQIFVTTEYHVAYNISYGVPILCFNVWKQDGTLLGLEDYWKSSEILKHSNIYDTLTQMDHPVLCKPYITLHPCRTQDILQSFSNKSKNPVISWLSVVGPVVHMELNEEYLKNC